MFNHESAQALTYGLWMEDCQKKGEVSNMRTKSVGCGILACLILILGACQNPSSTDAGNSIQWQ
ncbi:MAG: hypothetical protein WCL50_15555, partial [Spirochaetota bacterium]